MKGLWMVVALHSSQPAHERTDPVMKRQSQGFEHGLEEGLSGRKTVRIGAFGTILVVLVEEEGLVSEACEAVRTKMALMANIARTGTRLSMGECRCS